MNNTTLIFINLPTLILIIITLLAIGACFFLIGHYYGSRNYAGVYNIRTKQKQVHNTGIDPNISIDDKKIVTKINTDSLEKKYNNLGDKTESTDNILESVNKLKNIKR